VDVSSRARRAVTTAPDSPVDPNAEPNDIGSAGERLANRRRHAATFEQTRRAALRDQGAVARLMAMVKERAANAAGRGRVVCEYDSHAESPSRLHGAYGRRPSEGVQVQHVRAHVLENVGDRPGTNLVACPVQILQAGTTG
jgi:hypothetical protein